MRPTGFPYRRYGTEKHARGGGDMDQKWTVSPGKGGMEGNHWSACIQMHENANAPKCMHVHACEWIFTKMQMQELSDQSTSFLSSENAVFGQYQRSRTRAFRCRIVDMGSPCGAYPTDILNNRNAMGHPSIMRRTGRSPVDWPHCVPINFWVVRSSVQFQFLIGCFKQLFEKESEYVKLYCTQTMYHILALNLQQ